MTFLVKPRRPLNMDGTIVGLAGHGDKKPVCLTFEKYTHKEEQITNSKAHHYTTLYFGKKTVSKEQ